VRGRSALKPLAAVAKACYNRAVAEFFAWLWATFGNLDVASWLQAFAALVALFISVWATLRVGALERRRDRLQARGIAAAIYPELLKLSISVEYTRNGLEGYKAKFGNLVGQSVADTIQQLATIPIPPMIERNTDKLYLLGGAAGSVNLHLVSSLFDYNGLVQSLTAQIATMNAEEWTTNVIPKMTKGADFIGEVVQTCTQEVKPIYDAGL
jgi:hypothetical protein